jgi:hypothetical protein
MAVDNVDNNSNCSNNNPHYSTSLTHSDPEVALDEDLESPSTKFHFVHYVISPYLLVFL